MQSCQPLEPLEVPHCLCPAGVSSRVCLSLHSKRIHGCRDCVCKRVTGPRSERSSGREAGASGYRNQMPSISG